MVRRGRMGKTMKNIITVAVLVLSCGLAFGGSIVFPALPPAEYDDTEEVTNVALPAVRADSRIFAFHLELDATPSNNVSLVFGRDANEDGVISRAEESLLVGWDCGA